MAGAAEPQDGTGRGLQTDVYGSQAPLPGQPGIDVLNPIAGTIKPLTATQALGIGGSQQVAMIAGMEPVLSTLATIAQEMKKIATDLHVATVQSATYGGSAINQRQAAELVLANRRGGTTMTLTPGGAVPSPDNVTAPKHMGIRTGYEGTDAPAQGPLSTHGGVGRGIVHPAGGLSNSQMIEHGMHFSVGQARQDMANSWSRKLSQWHWGPRYEADEQGHYHDPNTGRFVSTKAAQKMIRRDAVVGKVKSALGELGEGKGLMQAGAEMLPEGMAMGAGIAVGGVVAANQALNFATSQRAANARWQQIMGGSNSEGFKMRAGQQLFEWGNKGFMGSGEAGKLYQGAYALNYRGSSAAHAMEFGTNNYGRYGMSVDDSLGLLNTAASTGQSALIGLAQALDVVTKSAREAGTNAKTAQTLFTNYFKTTSATAGIGSAPALAAGMTSYQTALGPSFQNADFSGMLGADMGVDRINAQRMGMSLSQYMAARSKNPTFGAKAAEGNAADISKTLLTGRGMALMHQQMAKMGIKEGGSMSPAQAKTIGTYLMSQNVFDVGQASQTLSAMTGERNINPNEIGSLLVRNVTSPNGISSRVSAAEKRQSAHTIFKPGDAGAFNHSGELKDIAKGFGWNTHGSLHTYTSDKTSSGLFGITSHKGKMNDTKRLYVGAVEKSGVRSPLVERLIESGDTAMRLRVKTRDKKDRVVTLDNALRYFYDQLVTGEAEIVKGDAAGQNVSDATGSKGTSRKEATAGGGHLANSATMKMTGDMKSAGDTAAVSKHKGWGGKGHLGKLIVEPTPALEQLLHFIPQGDVAMRNSRYAGEPVSPNAQPSQRGPNGAG